MTTHRRCQLDVGGRRGKFWVAFLAIVCKLSSLLLLDNHSPTSRFVSHFLSVRSFRFERYSLYQRATLCNRFPRLLFVCRFLPQFPPPLNGSFIPQDPCWILFFIMPLYSTVALYFSTHVLSRPRASLSFYLCVSLFFFRPLFLLLLFNSPPCFILLYIPTFFDIRILATSYVSPSCSHTFSLHRI